MNETRVIKKRHITMIATGAVALILALAIGGNAFEEVDKGEFQVRQRWITGEMAVKTTPGMWSQFGDVETFPKSETFFFTSDEWEGEKYDQSIKIQFADGSWAQASGTARIVLPTTESDILYLVKDLNYGTFKDVEAKLTTPVIRKSLNATAKLMTARESYSEKYNDFIFHATYQIEHGLYVTKPVNKKVIDPLSGEEVTRTFQEIQYDEDGEPLTQVNSLDGTGVVLQNFEIKGFEYDKVVLDQIATQQKAMMAVATKKLEAQEAEQEKIKITALGKAAVEKAKYEMEEVKIREVTEAEKEKAVAELKAQKNLEVAKLDKLAAQETKEKEILLGQGEAERKRLNMTGAALNQAKIDATVEINKAYATAIQNYSGNWVPTTVLGSGGASNGASGAQTLIDLLTAQAAKDVGTDLRVNSPQK